MKAKLILTTLLCYLSFFALGQSKESVCWKIEKKGFPTSHLLMTTKVQSEKVLSFDKKIYGLIDKSDAVFMNIHMTDEASQTMKKSLYMEEGNAETFFSAEQIPSYKMAVDSFMDINYQFLKTVKPSIIALNVYGSLSTIDASESMKDKIEGYSVEKEKEIVGFESIEERLALLKEMSPEELALFFDGLDKVSGFIEKEEAYYLSNDVQGLQTLYFEEEKLPVSFRMKDLADRNSDYFNEIIKWGKEGKSSFVLLDVVHVLGEDGVLEKLKKKGFQVTAIPLAKTKVSAEPTQASWYMHRPEGENFVVSFPDEPKFQFNTVKTEIGEISTFSWEYTEKNNSAGAYFYKASYIDYPDLIIKEDDKEEKLAAFFEAEKKALAHELNGEVLKDKAFTYKGKPAYQFQIRSKENNLISHFKFFIVGSRSYTLEALTSSHLKSAGKQQVTTFFDSFIVF